MKHIFPILIGLAFVLMVSILIEASLGNTSSVYRVDTATLTMK